MTTASANPQRRNTGDGSATPTEICWDIPLYAPMSDMIRRALEDANKGITTYANPGLLYDRAINIWSGPGKKWKTQPDAKKDFLRTIMVCSAQAMARTAPLLASLHDRRQALWVAMQAKPMEVTLAAPLVSGVGMSHALKTGFVWDRNLGVPYLPGSSLKGAVRAWAAQWEGRDDGQVRTLFGDLRDHGAGAVVFHDLYPKTPPALRLDVLNPHFKKYYEGESAPGDWLSPEPIFFLTVPPGTAFITALTIRTPSQDQSQRQQQEEMLNDAEELLRQALATIGIGAKTAVGYGLFDG